MESGPGRINVQILCKFHLLGFILYPDVTNTTSVSQEADRNYGPFKKSFCQILDVVVQNCITANKLTSLPPWIVGLVVFGGNDTEPKKALDRNASEDAFIRSYALMLGPR